MSMYQPAVAVAMADKGKADVYKTYREYQDKTAHPGVTGKMLYGLPTDPLSGTVMYKTLLKDQKTYHNLFKVVVGDS